MKKSYLLLPIVPLLVGCKGDTSIDAAMKYFTKVEENLIKGPNCADYMGATYRGKHFNYKILPKKCSFKIVQNYNYRTFDSNPELVETNYVLNFYSNFIYSCEIREGKVFFETYSSINDGVVNSVYVSFATGGKDINKRSETYKNKDEAITSVISGSYLSCYLLGKDPAYRRLIRNELDELKEDLINEKWSYTQKRKQLTLECYNEGKLIDDNGVLSFDLSGDKVCEIRYKIEFNKYYCDSYSDTVTYNGESMIRASFSKSKYTEKGIKEIKSLL